MLITLLAWIYITFLCWTWGIFLLKIIKGTNTNFPHPHFSIVCITGLSAITVIAGLLSLVIPLGNWWVQLFFVIPSVYLYFRKEPSNFFLSLKKEFSSLHALSFILVSVCLLLILVMSSWTIVHPDTLGYHAQTIQWIEKYKAVPGIVHLHVRLGYQGLWFVDNALFGLSFTGTKGITFLNSTVLLWFFMFITNKIDRNFFKEGNKTYGLLWIVLLLLTMWSYTQVRLTATSASPDFIATLFIFAAIYLLFEKEQEHLTISHWLLVAFLSLVAVTIKLSVAPVLLIAAVPAVLTLAKRKIKLFLAILAMSALTFTPFIARNIIVSGYVVFPSTFIDLADVDWKYSPELTVNEKDYITAYAKKAGVSSKEEIDTVNKMNPAEWLPGWWQNRSLADKTIMILLLLSFFTALLFVKRMTRSGFVPMLVLITMLAGIIFWFMNAPDPRFGFGAILGFIAVVTWLMLKGNEIRVSKSFLILIMIITITGITAYTGYRFMNFFSKDQWLAPLGIESPVYKTFDCDGIKINTPTDGREFGITPVPCTDPGCKKFSPRGDEIKDGFRAK